MRLAGGLLVFVVGCAGTPDWVRDTASAQWDCPPDAVAVTDAGAGHYDASGCGRHARYATHAPSDCPSPGCPLGKKANSTVGGGT